MTSWIDFYKQLTANSKVASAADQANRTNPANFYDLGKQRRDAQAQLASRPAAAKKGGGLGSLLEGRGPKDYKATPLWLLSPVAGIIGDTLSGEDPDTTVGGRVIDTLSRGLYGVASAAHADEEYNRANPDRGLGLDTDYLKAVGGAAWEGITGRSKKTTRDLMEQSGMDTGGVKGFAAMMTGDILLDPLSYVNPESVAKVIPGAVKSIRGAKAITDAEKATEGVAKAAPLEGTVVENKSVNDFLKTINRNEETPGEGIFDQIFQKQPNQTLAHPSRIPDQKRLFSVGPGGLTSEVRQIEGPGLDVIAARANLGKANELANGIPQFNYGSWVDEIPETGFYNEKVEKVLDQPENTMRPAAPTNAERQAIDTAEYADLADNADLPSDPRARIIMQRLDEPVYPRYEPYTAEHTLDSGKTIKWKAWRPNPEDVEDGLGLPMAEVRRRLKAAPPGSQKRKNLLSMLSNHIRAVDDYAKSGMKGFEGEGGRDKFYQEMYGRSLKNPDKPIAKADFSPLPDLDLPTYKEIRTMEAMDPIQKSIFLYGLEQKGLSPAHATYLAQASNPKSYATRLKKLQTLLREKATQDAPDLADAIEQGRIQDISDIPEAMLKHYNVKTLKQLAKAIRKDERMAMAAEAKMLKQPKNAQAATFTRVTEQPVEEIGPTGQPYRPYATDIRKMVNEAKAKAATNTPAKVIVERALNGDKSDLATPTVRFSQSHQSLFNDGLKWAVNENIISPKDASLWKYVTKTGVKRTKKTPGKGRGRVRDAWNKYSQYDFLRGMMTNVRGLDNEFKQWATAADIDPKDFRGARAKFMYNMTMKPMEAMDDLLKQGGIFPVAGTRVGDTPFSMYDALASLDPVFVQRYIFSMEKGGTSIIAPTQLIDAMNLGVTSIRKADSEVDDLPELIRATLLEVQKTNSGKSVPNGLPALQQRAPERVDDIVRDVVASLPELARRVERNEAARKLWHENQKAKATQDAFDELARQVESPDINLSKIMQLSNEIDSSILPKIQRVRGVDENDMFYVRAAVNGGVNEMGMPPEVRAVGKRAKKRVTQTAEQTRKMDEDAIREAEEFAARSMDEEGISLNDVATKFERTLTYRILTEIFPHLGNARVRDQFLKGKSAVQTTSRMYQSMLQGVAKKHAAEDIRSAFAELQRGTWSKNPAILNAQKDLNKAIGVMFADAPEYSLFNRNGLRLRTLEAHLNQYKVHAKFHPTNENYHNVWREWDTTDPLDLLGQYFAATMRATSKKILGDHLSVQFGSRTKQAGYVKIKKSNSPLLEYVNTDDLYFPEDIVREMRQLDRFMREEALPAYSDTTGGKLLRIYDNVLHRYKSGLTIYRPGHHVRNMIGDEWLTFMAGDLTVSSHTKALKVMQLMRGRYDDFDAIRALAEGSEIPVKPTRPDEVVLHIKIKGKKVPVTAGELHRAAYDRGLLPDYRVLEDIQIGNEKETLFSKGPFGGKLHKVASTISQSRDHYVRLSHLIAYLEKGNFANLDTAFEMGTTRVRKWHPDGSDLSHMEAKFARRTVMFYSWLRKAIPLVIEGMVMRPGRAMVAPKAFYNAAVAAGLDPNSISDPFPEDQMFPDWITDGLLGPIYRDGEDQYWGINPGIPMMDILGDYGNENAGRNMLGSVTPAIGVPFELTNKPEGAVAQDTRSGIPYFDKSDYVDSLIPNANLFTGVTGRSLTQPWESKGGEDREITPDTTRSLVNFLSGLGLVNMSKPAYIQQAKREQTRKQRDAQAEVLKAYNRQWGGK